MDRLLAHSLILLFTAGVSLVGGVTTPAQCNPSDRAALLKIKAALGDPDSIKSQWQPGTNCCDGWTNVVCDNATGRVIEVLVMDDNVSGHVSPAIADLPYVETLWFYRLDKLSGAIPPAIVNLKRLTSVRFSYVHLTGLVPAFFSDMKCIEYLDLSFNNFTGTIPPSLAALPNLQTLDLFHNHLTGTIPPFGSFFPGAPITYINLARNQLAGAIPSSLGELKRLRGLYLNRNQLVGDATFLFKAWSRMEMMDISWNRLAFDFSKAEFGTRLTWLVMDHNRIYGELPKAIAKLNLLVFDVSYNRLCGPIPQGNWTGDFYDFHFFHNRCLCGHPLDIPCR